MEILNISMDYYYFLQTYVFVDNSGFRKGR